MPDPFRYTEPTPDPYHPLAKGLTGEMLDAMLKAAFTEGVRVGRAEVVEQLDATVAAADQ